MQFRADHHEKQGYRIFLLTFFLFQNILVLQYLLNLFRQSFLSFEGELDTASRRRFALKVKFGYLKPEGIEALWKGFFPKVEMPEAARSLRMLTPGDFNAAYASLRFYDESELTAEAVLNALKSELAYKDSREGRTMGL